MHDAFAVHIECNRSSSEGKLLLPVNSTSSQNGICAAQ